MFTLSRQTRMICLYMALGLPAECLTVRAVASKCNTGKESHDCAFYYMHSTHITAVSTAIMAEDGLMWKGNDGEAEMVKKESDGVRGVRGEDEVNGIGGVKNGRLFEWYVK